DAKNDQHTFEVLARAGVVFLAGSDTNNLGTFQGFSLHREIALLRASELSSWDALAAATTRSAAFLGRPVGIHSGAAAELLTPEADPLEDVQNTQRIFAVVHSGRFVDR